MTQPRHKHNCPHCIYLSTQYVNGKYNDVYLCSTQRHAPLERNWHSTVVIRRYTSAMDVWEYETLTKPIPKQYSDLQAIYFPALKLAYGRRLITYFEYKTTLGKEPETIDEVKVVSDYLEERGYKAATDLLRHQFPL